MQTNYANKHTTKPEQSDQTYAKRARQTNKHAQTYEPNDDATTKKQHEKKNKRIQRDRLTHVHAHTATSNKQTQQQRKHTHTQ